MTESSFLSDRLMSFKDIDTRHRQPKGTAFRAFKRLGAAMREGEDYHYLEAAARRAEIEALRQAGRIHAATVNVVLLTPAGYEKLKTRL